MPFIIRHSKSGGYEVVRRDTGTVVAHPKDLAGARGYIYHSMKGEKKGPVHHGRRKK
jgi:hypothetical protein